MTGGPGGRCGDLVFVSNLSTGRSIPDYKLPVPAKGSYRLILDTDASFFGGQDRVDATLEYPVSKDGMLSIYTPARTAMVFAPVKE